MIDETLMSSAAAGDLDALAELDGRGFIIGADETLEKFIERVKALRIRIEDMEDALDKTGVYEIEGLTFTADRRIPRELIGGVSEITRKRYGFSIDWVPGFFADPSFGWLFGGCAYYFDPDFFALFIIRKSFAEKNRWLIYKRDELLSHELCHVARSGLKADFFEEEFAYSLSTSWFRKTVGGLFRSGSEAFYLLGGTMLILAARIIQLFVFKSLPLWPFTLVMTGILAYLGFRLVQLRKLIKTAREKLTAAVGVNAEKVLFRCTDLEILDVCQADGPEAVQTWLSQRREKSPRWQVIHHRFLTPGARDDTCDSEAMADDVKERGGAAPRVAVCQTGEHDAGGRPATGA
ncbi:MAG: hypothetical protein RRC34_03700 [Lentisphaeria bacterium]|nr:hypothetical protein [Lentisphaeria bacterium]